MFELLVLTLLLVSAGYVGLCFWAAWRLHGRTWAALCVVPLLLVSWTWWRSGGFPVPADPSVDPFAIDQQIKVAVVAAFLGLSFVSTATGCLLIFRTSRQARRWPRPAAMRQE